MAVVSLRVLLVLALVDVSTSSDAETTLGDIHTEEKEMGLLEELNATLSSFADDWLSHEALPAQHAAFWNLTLEVLPYSSFFNLKTMFEFTDSLGIVSLRSLGEDLNVTCGEDLGRRWTEITNKTCVKSSTKKWLEVELDKATEVTLNKFSRECGLQICSRTRGKFCTSTFGENTVKNSVAYIYDQFNEMSSTGQNSNDTIDSVLYESINSYGITVLASVNIFKYNSEYLYKILNSGPSIEPFKYNNLLSGKVLDNYVTETSEKFTWGIIRSSRGNVEDQCLTYRDIHLWDFEQYYYYSNICYQVNTLQSYLDLLRCSSAVDLAAPLSWSTAPSFFVHSACLCVVANSTGCRVKAPEGVPLLTHCFSILLRDFQKQVTVRPALTYADYSFMTKVPTCQFTGLLQQRFYETCQQFLDYTNFKYIPSLQCSFHGLVNETLNCTEMSVVNSANMTFLCQLYLFLSLVHCDADEEASVAFYSPGASPLVQVLTWLDVSVRLLTLVTFLACPQLRNLPGKLLMGYQVTALLRLLVAVAGLEDLAVAVRLDVSSDLSSSLWLSSFLHFLTSSFKTLRTPDSLSPREARDVLLRYSSLGWLLPGVLSASFFFLDEATWSHVQVGQLLFVLCYFAALLWNLHMFYFNCKFYYDVKKDVVSLRPGAKPRGVFAGLLNVALKTSVLSGAGIIFRLLFAQVQGLEELLGYYHALGSLQGLLVFLFYGCSRESRDFWRRVLVRKLLPCPRPPPNRVV